MKSGSSQQQQFEDEFKLLDISDASSSSSNTTGASTSITQAQSNGTAPSPFARFAFTSFNLVVSCSALAVAKQIVNPANYLRQEEATKEASKQLPSWFAAQYKSKRMAGDVMRNILRDTSVLMAASAMWYGVQTGLKSVRGKEDAVNPSAAGALSAALLGAAFIEPFKASRAGLWGALGAVAGYYGFQEQQALRAALLQRQQELEQKHMHKSPEEVHTKLDSQLLKQLLEKEHRENAAEFKTKMKNAEAASKADADAGTSENWQKLINTPPWLEQQQQQHSDP